MSHQHLSILTSLLLLLLAGCSRQGSHDSAKSSGSSSPPDSVVPQRPFGPTVAGRFYPATPSELSPMLRRYLDDGARTAVNLGPGQRLVGLVAPHAGYMYSGAVAGRAWALAAKDTSLRTIIVLGPSHHRARAFAATVDADVYRTPVGDVPIALDVIAQLLQDPSGLVKVDAGVLAPEHSVDVQIPFMRLALPSARVVPIVVPLLSMDRLEALAGLLYHVLADEPGVLVVASSDLSHFYDYASANQVDLLIQQEIVAGDVSALVARHDERRGPCGVAPIAVLLSYVKRFGLPSRTIPLERINSGDMPDGDKSRVVGYLAAALTAGTAK